MMRKLSFALIFSTLCTIVLATVSGITFNNISCYRYALADGIDSDTIGDFYTLDGSCESENKINRSFIVNCQDWYEYSKNWSSQLSQNGMKETRVTFSCIKRTYDGWLTSSGKKARVTLRSCVGLFDSSDALPDGCYRYLNRNSKIEAADQHVISDFDSDSKVDVCICNTNECNGAIRWMPWRCISITLIIMFIISVRFS
ncbi:unnamed protein product [Orchesella dallaii]|uniref:Protein quiver n=1 Tax=Orchesella dallaii TaxID=48710 RepID=A0ABP1RIS7_9HEXA